MTTEREEFEEWFIEQRGIAQVSPVAWSAWQAATAKQADKIKQLETELTAANKLVAECADTIDRCGGSSSAIVTAMGMYSDHIRSSKQRKTK